jgi:hypothetical protein
MKAIKPPDPEKDPRNFFKLSYQANPKIPFIVDCLEMREDEKYGRGIYATCDLNAGDVIAIEEPFFLETLSTNRHCMNCNRSNMLSLIPNADDCKFPNYFRSP